MASSRRNDTQTAPEVNVATAKEDTTLNLGHAGLASECWPGARGTGSGTCSSMMAAPRVAVLRLRRPASQRARHCPRPSQPADARFAAADSQFLMD
jgi:hypothetical protein